MDGETTDTNEIDRQRKTFADAFDLQADPLAQYHETFQRIDDDPLAMYMAEDLRAKGLSDSRVQDYRRIFRQFGKHMQEVGRHYACANADHIKSFAEHQYYERGKKAKTVQADLRILNKLYCYLQREPVFPHSEEYNPIASAREKIPFRSWKQEEPNRNHPNVPLEEIRSRVQSIRKIRGRCYLGFQLKLGARVGELCECKLKDVNLQHPDIEQNYPELGSHPRVEDYSNAIYIPPEDERERNKSKRGRILPLDDEMRQLLVKWLLIRPDNGEPWLFLSDQRNDKLWPKGVNKFWKRAFHPEYAETDQHDGITSHFGRHEFSSYWRVKQNLNRELIKYMRGDAIGDAEVSYGEAIDVYLHTYYEDIEEVYRDNIFKLGIGPY